LPESLCVCEIACHDGDFAALQAVGASVQHERVMTDPPCRLISTFDGRRVLMLRAKHKSSIGGTVPAPKLVSEVKRGLLTWPVPADLDVLQQTPDWA
jgi:hypothetical protein